MSTQRLEDCRRGLPEQLVEGERESLAERFSTWQVVAERKEL